MQALRFEPEELETAASRTLAETTGLAPSYLEQLYAFGDVHRSPTRVVSIVYWALLREGPLLAPASENVAWFDAATLPPLAFDHNHIVDYALWRLRNKVGYSRIAHGLLPELFTLADLREVYEAILGRDLDPANFRRQVPCFVGAIGLQQFTVIAHRLAALDGLADVGLDLLTFWRGGDIDFASSYHHVRRVGYSYRCDDWSQSILQRPSITFRKDLFLLDH